MLTYQGLESKCFLAGQSQTFARLRAEARGLASCGDFVAGGYLPVICQVDKSILPDAVDVL